MCVDFAGSEPMIYPCHGSLGNQHWIYDDEVSHGYSVNKNLVSYLYMAEAQYMETLITEGTGSTWAQ